MIGHGHHKRPKNAYEPQMKHDDLTIIRQLAFRLGGGTGSGRSASRSPPKVERWRNASRSPPKVGCCSSRSGAQGSKLSEGSKPISGPIRKEIFFSYQDFAPTNHGSALPQERIHLYVLLKSASVLNPARSAGATAHAVALRCSVGSARFSDFPLRPGARKVIHKLFLNIPMRHGLSEPQAEPMTSFFLV